MFALFRSLIMCAMMEYQKRKNVKGVVTCNGIVCGKAKKQKNKPCRLSTQFFRFSPFFSPFSRLTDHRDSKLEITGLFFRVCELLPSENPLESSQLKQISRDKLKLNSGGCRFAFIIELENFMFFSPSFSLLYFFLVLRHEKKNIVTQKGKNDTITNFPNWMKKYNPNSWWCYRRCAHM